MNVKSYLSTKETREMLRITGATLRNWDKANKIRTIRTPSGIRMYDKADVLEIIGVDGNTQTKRKICYCRVSSRKQSDDLERQKDFYRSLYPDHELVEDIGSGINFKRKGLRAILESSLRGEIEEVVVSHKDRLCRFAFELVEFILCQNNTKLLVLDRELYKSESEELADDVLSIIHIFSCKEMGRRRYKSKKSEIESDCCSETDTGELV